MSALEDDDAPEWTDEQFARAQIAAGGKVVRQATGTLTRDFVVHRTASEERQSIIAFIRKRSVGVDHFVQRGRLTAARGSDLKRWLGALADDIDAQLHDD